MLLSFSDDVQTVYTAVAIFFPDETINFIDSTKVIFKDITNRIDDYLDTGEWINKAGAYAIQLKGQAFIKDVDGDVDTVIGLPVKKVKQILIDHHVL